MWEVCFYEVRYINSVCRNGEQHMNDQSPFSCILVVVKSLLLSFDS